MDEDLLKAGRDYARRMHMSFNALVRKLVAETVLPEQNKGFTAESIRLMEEASCDFGGWKWNREEIQRYPNPNREK
ncbi:MAG: hypothetical protein AAB229_04485 [Candidatus Hydrogenedentota bacterium]